MTCTCIYLKKPYSTSSKNRHLDIQQQTVTLFALSTNNL